MALGAALLFSLPIDADAAARKRPKPLGDAASVQSALTGGGKPALLPGATIHIPTFRLEIVTEVSETASTSGFASGGRATQSTTYALRNLDPAQMARLTQAVYDELVSTLKAQGYQVATPAETRADPDLGPLMSGRPGSIQGRSKVGSSSFYAPVGLDVVIEPLDPSMAQNPMGAFASSGVAVQRALAVNRAVMRGLTVLQPKYTLGFVDLTSSTDGFAGRLMDTASVSASVGLRVEPDSTRWDLTTPANNRDKQTAGFFAVETSLVAPGQAFTPPVNATSAAQAQGTALGNLISMGAAAYTGSTNNYGANTKAVQPSPAYPILARQALSTVQSAMLARAAAPK